MKLCWPFARRRNVVVIPAPMTLAEYNAKCLGEEVKLLANAVLMQTRFVPCSSQAMTYYAPDGREFEVSVAARSNLPAIEEKRLK